MVEVIDVGPGIHSPQTQSGESFSRSIHLVIAAAKDLGVAVVAYAPLGRGFLTGKIRSRSDPDKNDPRLRYERFSEEVRYLNA